MIIKWVWQKSSKQNKKVSLVCKNCVHSANCANTKCEGKKQTMSDLFTRKKRQTGNSKSTQQVPWHDYSWWSRDVFFPGKKVLIFWTNKDIQWMLCSYRAHLQLACILMRSEETQMCVLRLRQPCSAGASHDVGGQMLQISLRVWSINCFRLWSSCLARSSLSVNIAWQQLKTVWAQHCIHKREALVRIIPNTRIDNVVKNQVETTGVSIQ